MDEREFYKEFGELSARIEKLEKEVEELKERVRRLEVKIAFYTGVGVSIGTTVGISIEAIAQKIFGG
ncbi:MAG: hypothetical protein DSY42_05705 [Aquifex sp.]|nr:MAG: hypothetical protein DSY42_05705 [Aquifex sp.]